MLATTLGALAAGGFALYPLLVLKWHDGSLPFSPHAAVPAQRAPAGGWPQIDTSTEPYLLAWPAQRSERPAPELSLRILPTDWYAWWSLQSAPLRTLPAGGLEQVLLEVSIPNADAVSPEDMAPLCELAPRPLGGCNGARARVFVDREGGDLDILLGERAPPTRTRVAHDGRNLPVLHEFWSRVDRDTGREQFLGWDCPSGEDDLPLRPVNEPHPAALYQCFEPDRWWQRKWPKRFGYERRKVYTPCSPGVRCEMLFLFAGRRVKLDFVELMPEREVETARFRLLLSAWEMLNRQRHAAAHPPDPAAELPEARAQLALCTSVAREAATLTRNQRIALSEAQRRRMRYLGISCEKAAHIGARMVEVQAEEAEALLGASLRALATLEAFRSNAEELFDAWFAALEANGHGEGPEALAAALLYLRSAPRYAADDPQRAQREERVRTARALLQRLGPALPEDQRAEAYRLFESEYRGDAHQLDLIALLLEHAALIAQQHGASSRQVLEPLQTLVAVQSLAGDIEGLRETIEQLQLAWFAQAVPEATLDLEGKRLIAGSGLYLVYGLRMIAFREDQHVQIAPRIDEVVTRMRALLGNDDPFVRGAQFHQREVLTRKFVPSLPGGGLYATPHY